MMEPQKTISNLKRKKCVCVGEHDKKVLKTEGFFFLFISIIKTWSFKNDIY